MAKNALTTMSTGFGALIKKAMTPKEALIMQLALDEAMEKGLGLESGESIEITLERYSKVTGLEVNESSYAKLKEAGDLLYENSITYKTKEGCKGITRLISSITYCNMRSISIDLCDFVIDEVLVNKEVYKIFYRKIIIQKAAMEKEFSKQLYDILLSWVSMGRTWFIGVDTIQESLGVDATEYLSVEEFEKEIIKPALAEINNISHLSITYEFGRTPNGNDAIAFDIKCK